MMLLEVAAEGMMWFEVNVLDECSQKSWATEHRKKHFESCAVENPFQRLHDQCYFGTLMET